MCSASLDKEWLEEFVLQLIEFSIAKQKSNSIQDGLHRESKSDLLAENSDFFWFARIRKKTNSDSEYGFRPCSNPCERRFVGTHEHVTGAEDPSRIENKAYTQTFQKITSKRWTTIAEMAGRQADHTEVCGSNIGTRPRGIFFEKWLVSKIASTSKRTCGYFSKNPVWFEIPGLSKDSIAGLLDLRLVKILTGPLWYILFLPIYKSVL